MSDQEFDFDRIAAALGVDRATLPPDEAEHVGREAPRALPPIAERLRDDEWAIIKELLPKPPVPQPGRDYRDRDFVDAALWWIAARERGLGWGHLPDDLGPASSREHRFARWTLASEWEKLSAALENDVRLCESRRRAFKRIAADASARRKRILAGRARVTGEG
ncbi:MAG: transposase [Hyphomicrobiaceae bacterium]|nr:transposase [Hyphomicrobiaceae bacterium]